MKPANTEERSPATAQVQVNTERMLITKWSFAPGEQTGWHRHMMDYAVVPLTNGTLLIEAKSGNQSFQLVAGATYSRSAGVEHNVVNASDHPVAFVEIELR